MTRLRAPSLDGALVAVPELTDVPALLQQARRSFTDSAWSPLRAQARQEIAPLAPPNAPWLLAGHQPELFHPGVWVKNFALAGLARHTGAFPLNLIVDSDIVKSTTIRLPIIGPDGWPALAAEPFDRWHSESPWEERFVSDHALFNTFGERLCQRLAPWGLRPLAETFWPLVLAEPGPLGTRFATARQRLERQWGCQIHETPLSRLCATRAFGHFVWALLEQLPRFLACYNSAVLAYREREGIRSHSHPVPTLTTDADWLELPLWGWQTGQHRRERVFARPASQGYELRAGPTRRLRSPEDWPSLETTGFKVRSRALMTTLFTRLFLADVFLHGIGGGKYDELTDDLFRSYFGLQPPPYVVLSATRWLPVPGYPATEQEVSRLKANVRQLDFNPGRFLNGHPAETERRTLLASRPPTRRTRRTWFARLRQLLEPMRHLLAPRRAETVARLHRAEREARANAILRRRDYSFILYPEESLRPFLSALLRSEPFE